MAIALWALTICTTVPATSKASEDGPVCSSLGRCIAELRSAALTSDEDGFSGPDGRIAREIVAYGEPGIEALVEMLGEGDPRVRLWAAIALSMFDSIGAHALDELIDVPKEGVEILYFAIGKIGTHEALIYLQSEFLRFSGESPPPSPLAWAISQFDGYAIPFWLDVMTCRVSCGPGQLTDAWVYLAGTLLTGPASQQAWWLPRVLSDLSGVLENGSATAYQQAAAMEALYELRQLPPAIVQRIVAIFRSSTGSGEESRRVHERAGYTLVKMRHPAGLDFLMEQLGAVPGKGLSSDPSDVAVRNILRYEEEAKRAAPELVEALRSSPSWNVRADAAYALGVLRYAPAIPALRAAISRQDWVLAYNAVESLAKLDDKGAIPLLRATAADYWFVAVRRNAERALARLSGGRAVFADEIEPGSLPLAPDWQDLQFCNWVEERNGYSVTRRKTNAVWRGKRYELTQLDPPRADDNEMGARDASPSEDGRPVSAVFALEGGMLVGTSNGEWGGSLWFISNSKAPTRLIDDNVQGIFEFRNELIVLTGNSHMGHPSGTAWKIEWATDETPRARPWLRLPYNPYAAGYADNGALIIVAAGGALAIDGDEISEAVCVQ